MNVHKVKEESKRILDFLTQKKVLTIITIVLLILIIGFTAKIRTNNISSLKDATTGEYLTADLDAFYWLRLADYLEQNGSYSEYDIMRYPALKLPFSYELLPHVLVFLHKILEPISEDMSLAYVDVIYPVIFFILSMFMFFFLILKLTKSKITALLSSFFLAIIPAYLFRTMAGVSDHEPIGMFTFFLSLLSFTISMEKIEKENSWKMAIVLGIITGFFTIFNIASWSGIASFVLLIIPITILLLWITNNSRNEEGRSNLREYLLFYFFWIISFFSLGFIFSYPLSAIKAFVINLRGIIVPLVLIFIIIDYLLIKLKNHKLKEIGKYRIIVSLVITIIFLALMSLIFNQTIGLTISNLISMILRPFGGGRTGSTVAENALPYTLDIIGQIGKTLFWLFFVGSLIVGVDFARGIGKKKNKIIFSLLWIIMICGIIFHRYSTSSLMNGNSFISKFFYLGSIIIFIGFFIWIYFKDKIEMKSNNVIVLLLIFFMALSGISAVRLLFIFTPVVCFMSAYALIKTYHYAKDSKEEVVKIMLYAVLIGVVILLVFTSISYIKAIKIQSSQIGSSANPQWQYSMKWVRENTQPGDIFIHWWDYGYWVQYMGERPTVTDGGHGNGYWDHLTGRYLLTTPYPETALSLMKAHEVSYLLIDPTDIGKYSAYSSIGSNKEGNDRFSFIPTMISDPNNIQETKNGTIRIYNGGYGLDGDIVYENEDGEKIFIPTQNSGIGGIILEKKNGKFQQPIAAYIYNGNQINIPVRYLYYNETLYDFKNGTNTAIYIIPQIIQVNSGLQLDEEGALIYLSPKVVDSLIAQLYLMNDPLKRYETVELAHSEPDPIETYLEMYSSMKINEFFYFNGLRGPLKIWEVNYPDEIIAREEFTKVSGEYAELDDLIFVK
ncbi:MAG: STT3 domain-containing protein [Nanobdellota archaeon]